MYAHARRIGRASSTVMGVSGVDGGADGRERRGHQGDVAALSEEGFEIGLGFYGGDGVCSGAGGHFGVFGWVDAVGFVEVFVEDDGGGDGRSGIGRRWSGICGGNGGGRGLGWGSGRVDGGFCDVLCGAYGVAWRRRHHIGGLRRAGGGREGRGDALWGGGRACSWA